MPIGFDIGHDLDFDFSRSSLEFAISQPKWFDCHKMKSTSIDWTEDLGDHQVWPWPWPWKVMCKDLLDSDRGDFRCWHAVDMSSFNSYLLKLSDWGQQLAMTVSHRTPIAFILRHYKCDLKINPRICALIKCFHLARLVKHLLMPKYDL